MNKENIASKQGIAIMILFIIGSTLVLGVGGKAKQDIWIAVILAMLGALIITSVYARILHLFPGKNLYSIVEILFGSILGKIISIFYIFYVIHLGALVFRNFSEFIHIVSLIETPQFVLVMTMGITSIWFTRKGIEVLGRWSLLILPIVVFIIISLITLSTPKMDINNLKPILYEGIKPVIDGSFSIFTFPFAETIVFTMILSSLKNTDDVFKVYRYGIVISGLLILIVYTRNILVLGVETDSALYFPSYSAVSLIKVGDFIQRIEVLISVIFLFSGLIKISICIYGASIGIANLFNFADFKLLIPPVALITMNLSCFIYDDVMEMFFWASNIYKYYAIPFQIVLPMIILIIAEIKKGFFSSSKKDRN